MPSASNSASLGGQPASAYARAALEPTHEVGEAGEPPFQNGWRNANPGVYHDVGYYKDGFGIVHLTGRFYDSSGARGVVFTLPAAYRPAHYLHMPATLAGGPATSLMIERDGDVIPDCDTTDCAWSESMASASEQVLEVRVGPVRREPGNP